jgi:phosphoribosylaminoimidazolecarboxamide formyltransferase/IMP cyclohydrolase
MEAFAHTAAYDARIATDLPGRLIDADLLDGPADPYPSTLIVALDKVETLRYGENPHQPAARYRRPGTTLADGLFGEERLPLQGKPLSYNNVLDAAAASALGRALRGPGVVIVKHTNPCGAAERPSLFEAWTAALEADPVSAFGGVVALTRPVDRAMAEPLTSIFLEIVIAPAFDDDALEVLATKPNLRVLVDPALTLDDQPEAAPGSLTGTLRTAGGAVLVSSADLDADRSSAWTCVTKRGPTDDERLDLDLAWRLVRGITSNAIALVRQRRLIGMGSGQTSRVDAARQAVGKAHAMLGSGSTAGASCASDAFFPFPDAVETCLESGIGAFIQPGGSLRDADAVAAADAADATMLVTGVRHFRH